MQVTKECKHGTFTFLDNDKWIGRSLLHLGSYSEPEIAKLLSLITEDSIVLEVGANIGAITVPLARKASHIYAFEPQPKIYDLLCQNLVNNDLFNATAVNLALTDKSTTFAMTPIDYNEDEVNTGGVEMTNGDGVQATTIDEYFTFLPRLDLVKIDVEGMELDVVKGAEETIKKYKPLLYMENDRAAKSPALIEKVFDLGYRAYWHFPLLMTDQVENRNYVSINMLCTPKDRKIALDELAPVVGLYDDWFVAFENMSEKQQRQLNNA